LIGDEMGIEMVEVGMSWCHEGVNGRVWWAFLWRSRVWEGRVGEREPACG